MNLQTLCDDESFGPIVKSTDCRGGFDFTVTFEDVILGILPAVCFIALVPFRALRLIRREIRLGRNTLYASKLGTIGAYTAIQVAILALTATNPAIRTDISVASAVLSVFSALSLAILSHFEHTKSVRPSFIINLYLLSTVLFDIARVRTQWLIGSSGRHALSGVLSASLAVKLVNLLLEALEKHSLLLGLGRKFSLESTSGLISRSSFWWLNSLLLSGYNKLLTLDDLPAIYEKLDSAQLAARLQSAWDACDQGRRHALARACVFSLRWEVLMIYIPKLCYAALSVSQVFLIQHAVKFVQGSQSKSAGYGLIGAFALVYIGLAITMGWTSYLSFRLMAMIRGQLMSIIYTKMLTLALANASDSAAMSLMGTDVQRIAETFWELLVEVLPSLVQLGIAVYLLYVQLGAVCVAPVLVAAISTGLSVLAAKLITTRQRVWLEAVQCRINYTSEILGSMKSVKMLGLSHRLFENIRQMRTSEIAASRNYRKIQSLNISLVNLPEIFNAFFLFTAYAIMTKLQGGRGLSVSQAITSLAALNLLAIPLAKLLYAIPQGWAALGCFARIQEFLLEPPRSEKRKLPPAEIIPPESTSDQEGGELQPSEQSFPNKFGVGQGSFGWSDSKSQTVKVNVPLELGSGLTILVGPVGAGKSTFLKGLLGETPRLGSQVEVSSPEVAYCDQTPWMLSGSIRDNIVAGSELKFDPGWYATVCRACALDIDFRQMGEGDSTVVGSNGFKMSGGQKQRISIARGLYSRKKLAVLDDVLSGLDSVTEELVFKSVFSRDGLLRKIGAAVILATHSAKHLPHADLILILNQEGEIVEQGTFEQLNTPGSYIHDLQIKLEDESSNEGRNTDSRILETKPKSTTPVAAAAVDESRRHGDWVIYNYYARALGPVSLMFFALLVVGNSAFMATSHVWLNLWAKSNDEGGSSNLGYWLGIFGLFSFMSGLFMVLAVAFLWVVMVPRSGKNFHRLILDAALKAPLSFFAITETGVLVNRFSQDLRYTDMTLPGSIINMAFQIGTCLVSLSLSVAAVGYFAAILPVVLAVLYLIQNFYLRTSRQLRLLELEANAPMFTQFIESLAGLITIRSFGWTRTYTSKTTHLVDQSQKPYYLLLCVQRWLVLVLDLVVAGLALVLVGMAVALRSRISAGFLGLALVNMMGLSHSLTNMVQHWTNLEISLGAVARIKDFADNTPVEKRPGETPDHLDSNWPSKGALRFEGVSARYGQGMSIVLKNLSFSVEGGQKIGIVGRTGSGKSSCMLAILRLLEVVSGTIVLDDVDLASIPGSVVRDRLVCLTQDPFLYSASVRSNVDPLGTSSDNAIAAALKKIKLWDVLGGKVTANKNSSNISLVLDKFMDTGSLSHGQRQLFCLARAMLKPGKVLILDEPTSSVDSKTDALIQELIRSEFRDYTIIMITHRLSTLHGFDKVAVLDGGNLVEFGRPDELLEDRSGYFARLSNS